MKIDVVQLELKRNYTLDLALDTDRIYHAAQAAPVFCEMIGALNVEHTAILCLDHTNRVVDFSIVSMGETNEVRVSLAQMFRVALLSNASKIMIAHNHPSGVVKITSDDIDLTRKIAFFAKAFSMELIDSLVVSSTEFSSIRAHCKEL